MAAAETIPFVEILGEDHPTPDGTAIRDYVHVTDLVEAHVAALGQLQGGANRIVLNLGTGVGRSVREIINAAARVTSHEIPVVVGPRRLGDPSMLVADPAASMSAFGFSPRLSDIDTILRTAWPFFAR
jgi:UDP-arabinose 4-epimerase